MALNAVSDAPFAHSRNCNTLLQGTFVIDFLAAIAWPVSFGLFQIYEQIPQAIFYLLMLMRLLRLARRVRAGDCRTRGACGLLWAASSPRCPAKSGSRPPAPRSMFTSRRFCRCMQDLAIAADAAGRSTDCAEPLPL